jgi:thiol:disulfide interchange protein DsbD
MGLRLLPSHPFLLTARLASLLLFVLAMAGSGLAQQFPANDVSGIVWKVSVSPTASLAVGSEVTVRIEATLNGKWHVYSVEEGDEYVFKPSQLGIVSGADAVELVGTLRPIGTPHRERDEILDGIVIYYENTVAFTQRIRIKKPNPQFKLRFKYQACEFERFNTCIFPEIEIPLSLQASGTAAATPTPPLPNTAQPQPTPGPDTAQTATPQPTTATTAGCGTLRDIQVQRYTGTDAGGSNLLLEFLLAFVGGFIALLTPCVFPMIPMTVSFFTKKAKDTRQGKRDAILFVTSIVTMFTVVGLIITLVFGDEVLYAISVNPWVNLGFFVLLVVFALSFLGMFDISLPSSWSTKLDAMSEKGGFAGIFFMAAALVVASFSCTGPIIGTQLVAAGQGGVLGPAVVMFGFSLGFGIPFGFFAFFPGMLKSMPKSGGWMNAVKVTLGLLELALALKFLSIADLVWETHLLDRDVFITLWVVIFGLLGLYLLGKYRMPHDHAPLQTVSVPRFLLALASLAFALYLLPGLWGAPLSGISGYLPPPAQGQFALGGGAHAASTCNLPRTRYVAELGNKAPEGFCVFFDLCEAAEYARTVNKPLFLDFTGVTCANCRQVEHNIWTNPEVARILREDYVMVSLFADRDIPLPAPYQTPEGKSIEFLSQAVADFQKLHWDEFSQPMYAVVRPSVANERLLLTELAPKRNYQGTVAEYVEFLRLGLANYRQAR